MLKHFFYVLVILLITSIDNKIWTPEILSKELEQINSFSDPEFLIEMSHVDSIKTNIMALNTIYQKIDFNVFYVSRISNDYLNDRMLFAHNLQQHIYHKFQKEIKEGSITIIFALRQNILIIYPSEKVAKMLPLAVINSIKDELTDIIAAKKLAKATLTLFLKLDEYLKNYKQIDSKNSQKSKESSLIFGIFIICIKHFEFLFLLLILIIVFVYLKLKNKNFVNTFKKFPNIIKTDKCCICLENMKILANDKNLENYEEICDELNISKYIAVLKCGHIYHALCIYHLHMKIERASNLSLKCPLCRRNVLDKDEVELTNQSQVNNRFQSTDEVDLSRSQNLLNYQPSNILQPLQANHMAISEREMQHREQVAELNLVLNQIREIISNININVIFQNNNMPSNY